MNTKILSIICLAVSGLMAQSINITGTVTDVANSQGIEGATVVMSAAGLSATTDAQGAFTISGTAASVTGAEVLPAPVFSVGNQLTFHLAEQQNVSLKVRTLQGKTVYRVRTTLGAGQQQVSVPLVHSGVLLFDLRLGDKGFTLKKVKLASGFSGSHTFQPVAVDAGTLRKKGAKAVDTLLVTHSGYVSVNEPVEDWAVTGVEVSMVAKTGFGLKDTNLVLPDPDTEPVATGKPAKVFILMGQSNMIGYGTLEPVEDVGTLAHYVLAEEKYQHTVDGTGAWTTRNDVYAVNRISGTRQGYLTVGFGNGSSRIGPEFQFGHIMGHIHDEMVIIIKSSIGNRALGWDILPPNSERYEYEDQTYAAYGDSTENWPTALGYEGFRDNGCDNPNGTTGNCFVPWYAGKEYDRFTDEALNVLNNMTNFFPDYNEDDGYEIAGFGWFQGHRDGGKMGHATRYELNMSNLFKELKVTFDAPDAKFVAATSGFDGWAASGTRLEVIERQLAAADWTKHPEHTDKLMTVETRGFWREVEESPGSAGHHFNLNAETYYLVGNAMGWAMAELLNSK